MKWRFGALGYADAFTVRIVSSSGAVLQTYGPYGNGTTTSAFYGIAIPAGVDARYVHFVFTNPNEDSMVGVISEVEIWGKAATTNPPGTTNPTFSGSKLAITNSASTPNTGTAGRAHDGNPATNWSTGAVTPTDASLRLDLGTAQPVTGVKWRFGAIGQADAFTVRILSASGTVLQTYGPYGNGSSTSAFYGIAIPASMNARYVHFVFTNPNRDGTVGAIAEVEIWGTNGAGGTSPGTPNPTLSGAKLPITNVSANSNPTIAKRAYDGDVWSNWASTATTPASATITFDLGATKAVSGVKWLYSSTGYADRFTVTVVNGSTRTVLGTFGNTPGSRQWYGVAAPAGLSGRFIEVTFANPNKDKAIGSLGEIQVWGTTSGTGGNPGTSNPTFSGSKLTLTNSFDSPNTGSSKHARDGQTSTSWSSPQTTPASATITFDLGGARSITGIKWMYAVLGNADQFTVRTSSDNKTWTTIGSFGNATAVNTWFGTSTNVTARFVQFSFANPNRDVVLGSLGEVQVWGSASTMAAAAVSTPTPTVTPQASPVAGTPVASPVAPEGTPMAATPTADIPATPIATDESTPEPTAEPTTELTEAPTEASATPTAAPTEEPTATDEPTAEPTQAVVTGTITGTDGDLVNCRVAPVDGDPLTQLAEGDQVTITGDAVDGWVPVACAGQPGWVAEQFITIGEVVPTEPVATEDVSPEATGTAEEVTATVEPTAEPTEEPVVIAPYEIVDTGDTENSGTAWNTQDGDPATAWLAPVTAPQVRLYLDLGAVQPIERVDLTMAWTGNLPRFELWVSEDAETWVNATPNGIDGWSLWTGEAIPFELWVDARYLRIVIPNADQHGLDQVGGIGEIDVWPADSSETRSVWALGDPTTPTPPPVEPTLEPTVEAPLPTDEPVWEEPTAEPVVEEPAVEEPAVEEPVVEEPTWEEPTAVPEVEEPEEEVPADEAVG